MRHKRIRTTVCGSAVLLLAAAAAWADPPRVVKASPDNGDNAVDPKLREIRIEFDQDMDRGSFSFVGGGPKYPKTRGKPQWVSARVCVLKVKLEPNHDYWLSINSDKFKNFRNKRGQPAIPYPIAFRTGSGEPQADKAEPPAPLVIKAVPDHGDTDVDPGLREIRVEFDQDMNTEGFSWVGGGETYPKTRGEARWLNPRVCVMPVELEPGHEYWLSINSQTYTNFRSAADVPAEPYPIAFRTRGAEAEPVVQKELTPAENRAALDTLRRAINDNYSYRDQRGVDWDEQFDRFGPRLEKAKAPMEFAKQAARLLKPANDMHIWLTVGPAQVPTHRRSVVRNCAPQRLAQIVPGWTERSPQVSSGRFEDGIGYLSISSWSAKSNELTEAVYAALKALENCPGLIIDVRLNGGGDEELAQQVAGCFVDEPKLYAKHVIRQAEAASGFSEPYQRVLQPNPSGPRYRGRIAVLMGPANMSSCEAFLLMMKQVPRCKLVGQTSYGSSGNPKPFDLGNGVTVYLPSWRAMRPDGTVFEGEGIEPDKLVNAPPTDFETGDPVLEAALGLLR
ncbi:MAG: hypothetical protein KKB50_09920 [Planctomycetes bacterium]|nr:hypothetical protein [Planctomycetota bacterium]